jgi:hypothetical protein
MGAVMYDRDSTENDMEEIFRAEGWTISEDKERGVSQSFRLMGTHLDCPLTVANVFPKMSWFTCDEVEVDTEDEVRYHKCHGCGCKVPDCIVTLMLIHGEMR